MSLMNFAGSPVLPAAIYLLAMNIWLFAAMGIDKCAARRGRRRIAEKKLFLLALLGGSPGGIAAMYVFRHKTLHRRFVFGFPAILAMQLAVAFFALRCFC